MVKNSFFTCYIWNMRIYVMRKKFIADFHVLGLFMAKKHDLSDKFFPSVTCRCRTKIF
jgi:hypothetical protein